MSTIINTQANSQAVTRQQLSITELFGEPISIYSRRQAIEDGQQVDMQPSHAAMIREAGIRYPIYLTAEAFREAVSPIEGDGLTLAPCQDLDGRFWDVLTMLRLGIRLNRSSDRICFKVAVVPNIPIGSRRRPRPKQLDLVAVVGPVDHDDPRPAITIMLPGQD